MKTNYSKENLTKIVSECGTIAECIRKLHLKAKGGNYKTFIRKTTEYNIDISHLNFKNTIRDTTKRDYKNRIPIEDYLSNRRFIDSCSLKSRLLKENILPKCCNKCKNTVWLHHDIPLELHHKDGNSNNNNLNNLELLCPNCHSQTDNYRGRKHKQKPDKYCIDCGKKCKYKDSTRCGSCASIEFNKQYSNRPERQQLIKDLMDLKHMLTIAKKYNVSDNAVRKWYKFYQLPYKAIDIKKYLAEHGKTLQMELF